MTKSAESLLQLLQRLLGHPNQVREIHALVVTHGHFHCKSQWKNTLLFNALIRAHLGFAGNNPLLLFTQMLAHDTPPNAHTFASLLKALARSPAGPPAHAQAAKRGVLADPFVRTSLLKLYAARGDARAARKVFDEMPDRCVVACNAMIDALCRNGDVRAALRLLEDMSERDVVTWTTVVNGLRTSSRYLEAVKVFERMVRCSVKPNEATYVAILGSCVGLDTRAGLELGKQVHCHVIRTEARVTGFLGTALIDLYGKTGLTQTATNVFNQMPIKEVCSWNAMISAFGSHGDARKALALFDQMTLGGPNPNEVTFVAVLTACARGRLVEPGLKLFTSMLTEFGVEPVMEHYGCVVDLLGRAGLVSDAAEFVKRMPIEPDSSVLGALLGACKIHGALELGLEVGRKLIGLQGKHSGRYVLLSSIDASMQRWDRAADLRQMMVNAGVDKIPAYSLIA